MLERESIQQRGFHNIVEDGKTTGFQFRARSLYYRGLWLSQIKSISVSVDGKEIDNDLMTFSVDGKAYQIEEMKGLGDINWNLLDAAVISVKKDGGLTPGVHTIELTIMHSSSYMPPEMDFVLSTMGQKRDLILV